MKIPILLATLYALLTTNSPSFAKEDSNGSSNNDDEILLRWSSTGGGWRSHFACVGFANLFAHIPLLTNTNSFKNDAGHQSKNGTVLSQMSAISTTSGASWLSTQLFYSEQFYNRVVLAGSSDELYDFVLEWMDSYYNMSIDIINDYEAKYNNSNSSEMLDITGICNLEGIANMGGVSDMVFTQIMVDVCQTLISLDGDWALFVDKMLVSAAQSYGDNEFNNDLMAGKDNRVEPLRHVDLLIQSSLAPNSRVRVSSAGDDNNRSSGVLMEKEVSEIDEDLAVYLGPTKIDRLYSVVQAAAYVVNSSGTFHRYSSYSREGDFRIHAAETPTEHSFDDWEPFHLYPALSGTVQIPADEVLGYKSNVSLSSNNNSSTLSPAFGGGDSSVIQIASISSAAAAAGSPLIPSIFTQGFSKIRFIVMNEEYDGNEAGESDSNVDADAGLDADSDGLDNDLNKGVGDRSIKDGERINPKLRFFDSQVDRLYNQSLFDKFAVCNQWPQSCRSSDGMFLDGAFTDNPALAINVGQYHISGGDLNKTMKVILTNTNFAFESDYQYTQILEYFESPINEGVEPGGFLWPETMYVPYHSPQLFQEWMDTDTLGDLIVDMEGSSMQTAILKGTTVDNPNFGVRAGQQVEILLINLNEPITTFVFTPEVIEYFTVPLANMTRNIAENKELARRISDFVGAIPPDESEGSVTSTTNDPESVDDADDNVVDSLSSSNSGVSISNERRMSLVKFALLVTLILDTVV